MSIDLNSRLKLDPIIKMRKEKFGRLLNSRRHPAFSVNHDGAAILDLADGTRSVGEMLEQLDAKLVEAGRIVSTTRERAIRFIEICVEGKILVPMING